MPNSSHPARAFRRIVHRPLTPTLALLCCLIAGSVLENRAEASDADFLGTWRNVDADAGEARIEAGVDQGTADMGLLRRTIARRRILRNNPPLPKIEIHRVGETIEVRFGAAHASKAKPDGSWTENEAPDGSTVEVAQRIVDGALVQHTRASRGGSVVTFKVLPNGHLSMNVEMYSQYLPSNPSYTLVFAQE